MCWCTPELRTPFCGKPECNQADAKVFGAAEKTKPVEAKPVARSLHDDVLALMARFRTEYASVGTMKYKTGSTRIVIDDNGGTFRLTVKL